MNGWNSQHQEFTPAKGNPNMINYLISEFKLEGIVSFDEVNKIITTTFIHNRFIRLSDLLSLNVSKVIAFTLPQQIQVIRQLFELLQEMKQLELKHGDVRMENILLDLTSSYDKLDNRPVEIIFQLKLINFAQFNNLQMEDDFERALLIYRQITEYFPNYKNELDLKMLIKQQLELFLQSLSELQYNFSLIKNEDFKNFSWDSKFFGSFIKNYYKSLPIPHNSKQIYHWISQNHQYHLIVNHYSKLISSSFFNSFKYSSEPKKFITSYPILDFDQSTIPVEIYNIKVQVGEKSFQKAIMTYKAYIESELCIYLKQKGYFENINVFSLIIYNINGIIQFRREFFDRIIYDQQQDAKITKQINQIIKTYCKSSEILKNMVLAKINDIKSKSLNQQYTEQISSTIILKIQIIEQLEKFKQMGLKYSKLLIDYCINVNLGNEIEQKALPDFNYFIQLMVESWLSWIDQYIFNQQFSNIEQLSLIKKAQFIEFIQEKGFEQIKKEMIKYIEKTVEQIFQKIQN